MDLDTIVQNADSRRAAVFVIGGFIVWLVELAFSIYMRHLGLIMYSLLTIFRISCIAVSLVGFSLSQAKRTLSFSYGFARIETLLGFSACILAIFSSGYVFMDALFEILFEPAHPERHPSPGVIPFAMIGLLVNVSAVSFFSKEIQPHSELRHAERVSGSSKIDFVFAYVMDDLLSCSSVVIATWTSSWGSIFVAEPFSALICGVLLIRAVRPYAVGFGRVLLQASPQVLQEELDARLRQASTISGVLELRDEHFWTHTPGVFVGSLKARVSGDADEQEVLANIHRQFAPIITHLTIHVEKENWDRVGKR